MLHERGAPWGRLVEHWAILVVLGVIDLLQGNPPAAPMDGRHLLPAWDGLASVVLIVNSFFTYARIEVNAVHVDELRDPAAEFPRAIFVAMGLVLTVFILPTLVISVYCPQGLSGFLRYADAKRYAAVIKP